MAEHKHADLLRMAADNADQLFEDVELRVEGNIASVLNHPDYSWRPVKQNNLAILPNGASASNVYEAYEIGVQQGKRPTKPLSDDEIEQVFDSMPIKMLDKVLFTHLLVRLKKHMG